MSSETAATGSQDGRREREVGLTDRTRDLLDEIDVQLLDHVVVCGAGTVRLAARSLS